MNITRENIDELNAVVKVKLTETDYASKVEEAIKKIKKNFSMPGFRPGMVPASLIKKMHGKSILIEEINKLLGDELDKYIVDNNLEILGYPLPKADSIADIDWENQKEFEFEYNIAYVPQFQINLSDNDKVTYYNVVVDDKLIDNTIKALRYRYGEMENPDSVQENDWVFLSLSELDNNGVVKTDAVSKSTYLTLQQVNNQEFKSLFIGKKIADKVVIIPSDWITKDAEIERAFAFVKQEEILKGVSFEAIIKNIIRQKPHEINQEFFDAVFGKGVVNGIEEFRQKVKEELVESFKEESDHHFIHTVNHLLTDKIKFSLPDEFLKRWVKIANKKPITDEQIEKEYPFYANELKLELIQKKINQANNIVVTRKEIEDHITTIVTNNFKRNKIDFDEKTIKENVDAILNDNEKLDRFYEKLYQDKLVAFYQSKLGVTYKEVTPEEFNKEIEEHFKNHKH